MSPTNFAVHTWTPQLTFQCLNLTTIKIKHEQSYKTMKTSDMMTLENSKIQELADIINMLQDNGFTSLSLFHITMAVDLASSLLGSPQTSINHLLAFFAALDTFILAFYSSKKSLNRLVSETDFNKLKLIFRLNHYLSSDARVVLNNIKGFQKLTMQVV